MDEKYFNTNNDINITLTSEELLNKSILCPYVPKGVSLNLKLPGLSDMENNSRLKFDIILYNQIPQTEPKFITNITIDDGNNENVIMKYNVQNLGGEELVLFIKQSIDISKKNGIYTALNKVDKHPVLNSVSEVTPEQIIMEIKKSQNDKIFYEINDLYYSEYIDISFNIEDDATHDTRSKLTITQLKKEKAEDFDKFVLNLYKDGALEEDTSGNENDNENNAVSQDVTLDNSNTHITYSNINKDVNNVYSVKVIGERTVNSTNNTVDIIIPTHSKRITGILIKTETAITTNSVLDNITEINNTEKKQNQLQPKDDVTSNRQIHPFYIMSPYGDDKVTITMNKLFYNNSFKSIEIVEYV